MKKILVTCCKKCPYLKHMSGMGYGEDYYQCEDTSRIVYDGDSGYPDYLDTIPPWCKLDNEE